MASCPAYSSLTLLLALSTLPRPAWAAAPGEPIGSLDPVPNLEYQEAQALLTKKKWPEAVLALRAVLKRSPGNSAAAVQMARALTYMGRREEGLAALEQSIDREKGSRRAILVRQSRALARLFLTNATFQSFQEGIDQLVAKKYGAAREKFEKALSQEPDNAEILTRIGQCFVLDGDFDSAAEKLRLARKLSPHEPQIGLWLGRALHLRGELSEALGLLAAASSELEGSELAPAWYAEALSAAGQRKAAIKFLEKRAREHPLQLQALTTLARLRLSESDSDSEQETRLLWSARRELQLALSRIDQYGPSRQASREGELGLDLRDSARTKAEIERLIQKVDDQLEAEESSSAPEPPSAGSAA